MAAKLRKKFTETVRFVLRRGEGIPVVPVRVNGQGPFRFFVDTGAGASVISREAASRLGLVSKASHRPVVGAGGKLTAREGTVRMQVGNGGAINSLHVYVVDFDHLKRQAPGIDGVIGYNILRRFTVTFDYSARTLVLDRHGSRRVTRRG